MIRRLDVTMVLIAPLLGSPVEAADLTPHVLVPRGSLVQGEGFRLDLGEADDVAHPRAWQGPIRITAATGHACTVSDDVDIVERPLWQVGREFYVSTYSGSESTLYVVDGPSCAVRWTSPNYVGRAAISGARLAIPGQRPRVIGPDGIPSSP